MRDIAERRSIPPDSGGRFTEEELDFIPPKREVPLYGMPKNDTRRRGIPPKGKSRRASNYDIKYRVGKKLEGEKGALV
ncbi:hypothetical protein D4R75_08215 [bacterium]|nr:MAG: hypothetical protein D4R75_08215 [bacterium]